MLFTDAEARGPGRDGAPGGRFINRDAGQGEIADRKRFWRIRCVGIPLLAKAS